MYARCLNKCMFCSVLFFLFTDNSVNLYECSPISVGILIIIAALLFSFDSYSKRTHYLILYLY